MRLNIKLFCHGNDQASKAGIIGCCNVRLWRNCRLQYLSTCSFSHLTGYVDLKRLFLSFNLLVILLQCWCVSLGTGVFNAWRRIFFYMIHMYKTQSTWQKSFFIFVPIFLSHPTRLFKMNCSNMAAGVIYLVSLMRVECVCIHLTTTTWIIPDLNKGFFNTFNNLNISFNIF